AAPSRARLPAKTACLTCEVRCWWRAAMDHNDQTLMAWGCTCPPPPAAAGFSYPSWQVIVSASLAIDTQSRAFFKPGFFMTHSLPEWRPPKVASHVRRRGAKRRDAGLEPFHF